MTPTPTLHLKLSADIVECNPSQRLISGRIVPFGDTGNTPVGPVSFKPDSITFGAPGDVKLLLEHDNRQPVGRAVAIETRTDGMYATFSISRTTRGDDALVEAADGLRTGLSVGVEVKASKPVNGVLVVASSRLREVSLVESPAFTAAQITDVAASQPDETEQAIPSTEGTDMTDQVVTVEETAPAVEASSPAPVAVQASAPIFTNPRTAGMSSAEYVGLSVKAALGDHDARILITAANDSTTTNTGLTLPTHKADFITATFSSRPTIDAIGTVALMSEGMSYTIPRMGTAPTVATVAEAGATSATGMTSDYLTATVVKKSGMNTVSQELLERSAPNFGEKLLIELRKAYAKNTDEYVIAALTAGGTQAATTAGTIAGLQSFIATEGPAAYIGTGGDFATELVGSYAWWSALIAANDSGGRPLFPNLAPQNAPGQVSVGSTSAPVFGTNFRVDHNIATAGLIDESAFLLAPAAVEIAESPVTSLQVQVLTSGEVQISLHGYIAATVLKASGVRRFNLT